jgi:hypothetical protein
LTLSAPYAAFLPELAIDKRFIQMSGEGCLAASKFSGALATGWDEPSFSLRLLPFIQEIVFILQTAFNWRITVLCSHCGCFKRSQSLLS